VNYYEGRMAAWRAVALVAVAVNLITFGLLLRAGGAF
jgi:hypothetical protein